MTIYADVIALCIYVNRVKTTLLPTNFNESDPIEQSCLKIMQAPLAYYRSELDAEVLVGRGYKNELIYVFGQTNSIQDWISNVDLRKETLETGEKVHKGFYCQYKSLEDFIKQTQEKYTDIDSILFCGFSLGGVLATLACYFSSRAYTPTSVISVGAPPLGDKQLAKRMEQMNIVRIVMEGDLVPCILPWFRHPNEYAFVVTADDQLIKTKDSMTRLKMLITVIRYLFHCQMKIDHDIDEYYRKVSITKNE